MITRWRGAAGNITLITQISGGAYGACGHRKEARGGGGGGSIKKNIGYIKS